MADNVTLNPGAGGVVVSTEDIGGVQIERTKILTGGHGVDGGDVTQANPLPTLDMAGLIPFAYDYIGVARNLQGQIQTVEYRAGGVGGTIVATLTLTYASGLLASVSRT